MEKITIFITENPNTWGATWNVQGNGHMILAEYPPNEAWVDLETAPVIPPYIFTKALRLGSQGFDVKQLQKKLNITPDGFFGLQTRAAVVTFQKAHGLTADGVVGKYTNIELNK